MKQTMKRFYKTVAAAENADGFAILLDERPVKTPNRRVELILPTAALADAVATEWDAQSEDIDPASMPMTSLASTALDLETHRDSLVDTIAQHAETDPLCYWAPTPQVLKDRQQNAWQPLLDWVTRSYDARLNVTTSILPVDQPAGAILALHQAVAEQDNWRLAALSSAVSATTSLVVGLALLNRAITAGTAFEAAELEATYQIEQWGADAEAEKRRDRVATDLQDAEKFLSLLAC